MRQIRWGLIGLGNIATKFAQAIQVVDTATLAAVSSRSKDKAIAFGQQYGLDVNRCFDSYDALIKDPNIDAVYIALPHFLHKDWSVKALLNNKAVLCEKPSTLNEEELLQVIDTAESTQTFYMEAMKTRFLPTTHHVKKLLDSNTIGDIRLIYGDYGYAFPLDPNHLLYNKELGGGALMDVGVYPLAYTFDLFGGIYEKFESSQTLNAFGVDSSTSIYLKSPNNQHIHLFASIECDSPRDYVIVGTHGTISIPRFSNAQEFTLLKDNKVTHYTHPHLVNGLEYQIMAVNECLFNGLLESPKMTWDDSLQLIRAVDRIKEQSTYLHI